MTDLPHAAPAAGALAENGRGRVPPFRLRYEALLHALYRGNWPAKLWGLIPGSCRVHALHHQLALLPKGMPALRLAFISDLHIGPTTPARLLDHAFSLLDEARPDILLLGGDYFFLEATAPKLEELKQRVEGVHAAQKVAVLGNHDHWTDYRLIEETFARAGVRMLTNSALRLQGAHTGVALLGIDDPMSGAPDARSALAEAGDCALRLGLCHSPDGLELFGDSKLSLLLSGHTHGGQIATPFYVPYVPCRTGRLYPHGWHQLQDLQLFVSRGVGGVSVPMRVFAPPDVLILDLVSP